MSGDREAHHALDDSALLSAAQARALVRLVEEAPQVKRRYHFFNWLQTHVHALVPHVMAVCGAYHRQRREVVYDTFESIVLAPELMGMIQSADSTLIQATVRMWQEGGCRPYALDLGPKADGLLQADCGALRRAGLESLTVHGVARPQRPSEIESMFIMGATGREAADRVAARMELLLPHLHASWLRVQSVERELNLPLRAPPPTTVLDAVRTQITPREREILEGVREGKSNLQIGEALGISALTVKNHVQKILRKLGAHNRAQAVALTMGYVPLPGSVAPAAELAAPEDRRAQQDTNAG